MMSWLYGCRGNRDINADIVMHENCNSGEGGGVARRPELREVTGAGGQSLVNWGLDRGTVGLFSTLTVLMREKNLNSS